MLNLSKIFVLHYMNRYENDKDIAVNKKALPIILVFKGNFECSMNLLDFFK